MSLGLVLCYFVFVFDSELGLALCYFVFNAILSDSSPSLVMTLLTACGITGVCRGTWKNDADKIGANLMLIAY